MQGEKRIEVRGECLWANGGGANERDFANTCRALAVECVEKQLTRVLIDATDCHPEGVAAVRDAFTVMMLAGIPGGLRVALVTNVSRAFELFGTLERDLTVLRVDAKLFAAAGAASEWLGCGPPARALAGRLSTSAP